jgi:CubicO group peptidase (beta-lactamase class C family)
VPGSRLHGEGKMWAANAGPGAYFTYCNLGWGVIGTIMEKVTRRALRPPDAAPAARAAGPAPATTRPNCRRRRRQHRHRCTASAPSTPSLGCERPLDRPGRRLQQDTAAAPPPGIERYVIGDNATPFSPTGGLRISARDMGTVMLMLMNGGVHEGRRILQAGDAGPDVRAPVDLRWTTAATATASTAVQLLGPGQRAVPGRSRHPHRLVEGGGFAAVGPPGRRLRTDVGVRRRPEAATAWSRWSAAPRPIRWPTRACILAGPLPGADPHGDAPARHSGARMTGGYACLRYIH